MLIFSENGLTQSLSNLNESQLIYNETDVSP
jgi:hypothetical protein